MAAKRAVFDAASSGGVGELTLKSRLPNIGLLSKRLELPCINLLVFSAVRTFAVLREGAAGN